MSSIFKPQRQCLAVVVLFFSITLVSETFTNTNHVPNDKSFGDFLKWTLDGKNDPEKIQIEIRENLASLGAVLKNEISKFRKMKFRNFEKIKK